MSIPRKSSSTLSLPPPSFHLGLGSSRGFILRSVAINAQRKNSIRNLFDGSLTGPKKEWWYDGKGEEVEEGGEDI